MSDYARTGTLQHTRRRFMRAAAGLGGAFLTGRSAGAQPVPTINVRSVGAFGNGKASDLRQLREAIRLASERAGGATVFFPPGEYFLGAADSTALLTAAGLRNVRFVGERATVSCRSVNGQSSMILLAGCSDVVVEGLVFRDYGLDRNVNWLGAVALSIGSNGETGSENIHVRHCSFDSVLGAVSCTRAAGRVRARSIFLTDLAVRRSYYGFGFQESGDNVRARDLRCDDVRRSYFPYGVSDHDVEIDTRNNATGYTDVLIKCYSRDTSAIKIKARSRGKRGGDAIIALDNQHERGLGLIRAINVELDVDDADCRLETVMLIRSFDPAANVERHTSNRWDALAVDGNVRICDATRLIHVVTVPKSSGTLHIGKRLAAHPGLPARLPGFNITAEK